MKYNYKDNINQTLSNDISQIKSLMSHVKSKKDENISNLKSSEPFSSLLGKNIKVSFYSNLKSSITSFSGTLINIYDRSQDYQPSDPHLVIQNSYGATLHVSLLHPLSIEEL